MYDGNFMTNRMNVVISATGTRREGKILSRGHRSFPLLLPRGFRNALNQWATIAGNLKKNFWVVFWSLYFQALIIVFVCIVTRKGEWEREWEHMQTISTMIKGKSVNKQQTSSEKRAKTHAHAELEMRTREQRWRKREWENDVLRKKRRFLCLREE